MQTVKVTRKGEKCPVPARISLIFARNAPTAVIFRRGPSKWVQVLKWHTSTDAFEAGQWFFGRIYDRRSDLSPDGNLLLYFAQKINGRTLKDPNYTYAWTAISRLPYITALALWPKGDCWHGGGSFLNDRTIVLNHKPDVARHHPDHAPKGIEVRLRKDVCGEDDPIFSERLERDGWSLKQAWIVENRRYPLLFATVQPEAREKISPDGSKFIRLMRAIEHLDYSEQFLVFYKRGETGMTAIQIERASWVDWDQGGRLVIARDGKIFEGLIGDAGLSTERELIDLNAATPDPIRSPDWAARW